MKAVICTLAEGQHCNQNVINDLTQAVIQMLSVH